MASVAIAGAKMGRGVLSILDGYVLQVLKSPISRSLGFSSSAATREPALNREPDPHETAEAESLSAKVLELPV